MQEASWRRRYPLFPRLLFVLDGTGPAGIHTRIHASTPPPSNSRPCSCADVPVLAAPLTDLLLHGPAAPIWHPVTATDQRVGWMHTRHRECLPATAQLADHRPDHAGHSPRAGLRPELPASRFSLRRTKVESSVADHPSKASSSYNEEAFNATLWLPRGDRQV
ncbi:hypothetical protein ACQPXT_01225 [Streptomyces sp. CA-100214]